MKTTSDANTWLSYIDHIDHISRVKCHFSSIDSDLYLQIQLECLNFRNTPILNGRPELKTKSFCDVRPDPRTPLTPLTIHVSSMCVPPHLKITRFWPILGGRSEAKVPLLSQPG